MNFYERTITEPYTPRGGTYGSREGGANQSSNVNKAVPPYFTHIIFNAINLETHKKFRWTKSTKKVYEHISDKHADYAGAKII